LRWRPGYRCSMDLTRPGQQFETISLLSQERDHFGQSRYCGFLAWSIMHEHNQSALTCYGFLQPGKQLLRRLGLDGFRIAVQAVPVNVAESSIIDCLPKWLQLFPEGSAWESNQPEGFVFSQYGLQHPFTL
jgi:hypothetical protein